ncbi:MAG TPA: hypothetical protein GXZ90_08720 [Clostridiales bacterium]|nr:hypothetical protein [Clostridiales bacterium]
MENSYDFFISCTLVLILVVALSLFFFTYREINNNIAVTKNKIENTKEMYIN